jgi:small-conductance mechanosensitive channel
MSIDELRELAQMEYFGNALSHWAIAVALFALLFTVLPLVRSFVRSRLRRATASRSVTSLELVLAVLRRTLRAFLVVIALWVALRWLEVAPGINRALDVAMLAVVWFQVGLWSMTLVTELLHARQRADGGAEGAASLNILRFIGITAVWMVVLLMLLANLGVEIMPLVAGLGVGGIAVALAVQNVLGDLFASLSIALDKPFKVGDFLVLGDEKGTVEKIGIKSTRLRSLSGEMIVASNGDLLKSRVRNYGLLYERRAVFSIGIVYETPQDLVREVPKLLEQAIKAQPKTRFDRAHFASFGDYALLFEAVYFVLDPQYNAFMDIQQGINLWLFEEFGRRGIEFAYPTNKQFSVNLPAPAAAD